MDMTRRIPELSRVLTEKIPAGARVRIPWSTDREGILLDNSYASELDNASTWRGERWTRKAWTTPYLGEGGRVRIQLFGEPFASLLLSDDKDRNANFIDPIGLEYFINGQWLTFDQIMALP